MGLFTLFALMPCFSRVGAGQDRHLEEKRTGYSLQWVYALFWRTGFTL